MTGSAALPLGHALARDPLDLSREAIVEAAQRAAMYAGMLMDLATIRDDDGAALMRGRLVAEVKLINEAFRLIAETHHRKTPAGAAAAHFAERTGREPVVEPAD